MTVDSEKMTLMNYFRHHRVKAYHRRRRRNPSNSRLRIFKLQVEKEKRNKHTRVIDNKWTTQTVTVLSSCRTSSTSDTTGGSKSSYPNESGTSMFLSGPES